ncbi:hypothetical protein PBCV1_a346L [Paramecium bursaria Chlorella virus 1]|uniref:Uncharacterized protein n=1 Tax=Paramecium bursaria Chlorella virus 1 TaxID=10506 RepID=Q84660_PBCV1|nr:hypothetical protein PBCV1_a346L [Paramecium bursaria Chlorella virus 1]AAC96714.1 hypothetical protein [Paramecium bursaria Chlorella virus 1]
MSNFFRDSRMRDPRTSQDVTLFFFPTSSMRYISSELMGIVAKGIVINLMMTNTKGVLYTHYLSFVICHLSFVICL